MGYCSGRELPMSWPWYGSVEFGLIDTAAAGLSFWKYAAAAAYEPEIGPIALQTLYIVGYAVP